jgi:hypothetical protein
MRHSALGRDERDRLSTFDPMEVPMQHFSLRYLLLVSFAAAASAMTAPSTAAAIDCGGGTPCSCGDTVVESRTLVPGIDPVTTTPCPGSGLIIGEDGVVLNLGGAILRGSGVAIGIEIQANGTTVENGRVTNFRRGISGTDVGSTTISDVQILQNLGAGITLDGTGDSNSIDACIVRGNGGGGVSVAGNNNTVRICRIESNGGTGLTADGNDNDILRNIVTRNVGDGIHINGAGAIADRNQAKYNKGAGFVVEGLEGSHHTLTLNVANSNGTDGFTVTAHDSRFERNTASYNGRAEGGQPPDGYGIRDTTHGSGTSQTDNTYAKNNCTGNGLGNSYPPGLCN